MAETDFRIALLRATLEDTQASLVAALARIEAYRIREKALLQEIAQLRGHKGDADGKIVAHLTATDSKPKADDAPESSARDTCIEMTNVDGVDAVKVVNHYHTSKLPVYITELKDFLPVLLVASGRKTPASIVVTRDYVDFVEVKARIKQDRFVGITTARAKLIPCVSPSVEEASTSEDPSTREANSPRRDRPQCDPGLDPEELVKPAGAWTILWQGDHGATQQLTFEASQETRSLLHQHTAWWLGQITSDASIAQEALAPDSSDKVELSVPRHLVPDAGDAPPRLLEPSDIFLPEHLIALKPAVPGRFKHRNWALLYSTARHGISLQTLYRRAANCSPTVLVIRDGGAHIFGCFAPEPWKMHSRFYGTGETFVFQLEPHRLMFPWKTKSDEKNDYFMYGTQECVAVGGLGHFALLVDGDMNMGSSGRCGTFGSPCLAHSEDFKVVMVELWHLQP